MEGFNTNNDVPYPPNGHSGNIISIKDVIKSNLVESLIPNKQRLSVQFPVRDLVVEVALQVRSALLSLDIFRPLFLTTRRHPGNFPLRTLS